MKTYLSFLLLIIVNSSLAQVMSVVRDRSPYDGGSHFYLQYHGKLFFTAYPANGNLGLWATDGTADNTSNVFPIINVAAPAIPNKLVLFQDKIYFTVDGKWNDELWISDGTDSGTYFFADTNSNRFASCFCLTPTSDLLFFVSRYDFSDCIFISDGTAPGTKPLNVRAVNYSPNGAFPVFNNDIYFQTLDPVSGQFSLMRSNGLNTEPILLKTGLQLSTDFCEGNFGIANGKLFFSANDGIHGYELWCTDGTALGTYMVKDISEVNDIAYLGKITSYQGKVYFNAYQHGFHIFESDGTAPGTFPFTDIYPIPVSDYSTDLAVFDEFLYILGTDGNMVEGPVWKTDGTAEGTFKIDKYFFVNSFFMDTWDSTLLINNGMNICRTNGTTEGTNKIIPENAPDWSWEGEGFYEFNGDLFFWGSSKLLGINGTTFCKLSPTALPINVIQFKGEQSKNIDRLFWTATGEKERSYFVIEQSDDRTVFTPSGTVPVKVSNDIHEYSFSQPSNKNPEGYYRLKMVDATGKLTYSNVIKITRIRYPLITFTYSQGSKEVIVTNNTNQNVNWQLFDLNGRLIQQGQSKDSIIKINVSDLLSGSYFIVCNSQFGSEKYKIIVQ